MLDLNTIASLHSVFVRDWAGLGDPILGHETFYKIKSLCFTQPKSVTAVFPVGSGLVMDESLPTPIKECFSPEFVVFAKTTINKYDSRDYSLSNGLPEEVKIWFMSTCLYFMTAWMVLASIDAWLLTVDPEGLKGKDQSEIFKKIFAVVFDGDVCQRISKFVMFYIDFDGKNEILRDTRTVSYLRVLCETFVKVGWYRI